MRLLLHNEEKRRTTSHSIARRYPIAKNPMANTTLFFIVNSIFSLARQAFIVRKHVRRRGHLRLQDRRPRKRRGRLGWVIPLLLPARAGAPKSAAQRRERKKRGLRRDLTDCGLGHRFSENCRQCRYPLPKGALPGTCASMVLMVSTCSLRLCCLAATKPSGRFFPASNDQALSSL
jgi:hypothetical protein